jgi:glycosyltransferase involved in cell wall biosynthesis
MQFPPPIHGVSVMNQIIKDSLLINEKIDCDYINLATTKEIKDLRKSQLNKYFITLKILFQLIFKLISHPYDRIYITIFPYGFAFYKDAMMVLTAKLFQKKVLLHLHSYGFKKAAGQSKFTKLIYRFVFKNTEVICLSEALIEDIELIYHGEVFILPNGIPQVNFVNNYNTNKQGLTFLYLSNLLKFKGILLIMNAIQLLKAKGLDFKLRVVGSEGDITYAMLQDVVDKNELNQYVTFLGPKFGDDKFNEFKNADVFLFPSEFETFGLVLLEAMQYGVPAIASSIGAIPDIIGEGRGILLEELKPNVLADKMEFMINHPEERKKMSEFGFNYFKSNFTVEVFEQRCLDVLLSKSKQVNKRLVKN